MKPDKKKKAAGFSVNGSSADSPKDNARSKRRLPLMAHLAIGFLGFSVMLLIVLWLFQTVFLEEFYKSVKTRQVKACAYSLMDYIESDDFNDLISDIEEQNSMTVEVYDTEDSEFIRLYPENGQGDMNDFSMAIIKERYNAAIINGGELSTITQIRSRAFYIKPKNQNEGDVNYNNPNGFDPFGGKNMEQPDKREPSLEREVSERLSFAKVVNTSEGERLIVVESVINPVNSVIDTLRYQLIIMTVVIVILSIGVAIFVAKLISKPIADTTEKAKSLANQDYDVRFSGGRYREVTELNSTLNFAASELKKVDSLQKELIANISHDLRTPLTMITGYGEVMRDIPGEMTPENIQIIIDEASRLSSLVNDLLDLSRLQSGTADIKSNPFSLTKCIESIFERYNKLIESDGLNIEFEHDGEVFIMGDELRMTQVIYNLVNNAVNYIGDDNTVIVRQTVDGDKVRVDVIDHGEGIPADKLENIWDRYYRVDKEHRRAKIGAGLGLSIVKNILIAHNAEFGVESEPGKGSDFWFVLPIIPVGEE